jgi:hypothetical protein
MDVLGILLIGLAAGAIGTVAFTVVEYMEIALTKRPVSTVPGEVAVALTGGEPHRDRSRVEKLNLPTHFAHGTMLGLVFGALALLDLGVVWTTILFYVALLGVDWMMYVLLGVTPPPWRWGGKQLAREMGLKAILAIAVALAFYGLMALI